MELSAEQVLQKAIQAHKAGELRVAESLYRAILNSNPKHPDANHNLGVMAVSLSKTAAALPLFRIALEANPKQAQFWFSYLDALVNENQLENARDILEQGKKLGLAGEKVRSLEEKLVIFINNLEIQNNERNKLSKAIELREMGRYEEAKDWLTKIHETEAQNAESWSLLAQVFLLDNKDAEAEKALSTAILINPNLPSIYRNQARFLLKKSKPTEALLKAQSGYEQSSDDPESLIVLAACLGANQRDLEALPLIEVALKARPNYAEAFTCRAMIRLRAKNTNAAIEDLEKAIALKPHLTQIWELLGALRYKNKNLSGAIDALKKARALEPNNVNFMINLGEFLRQDQRIEEALIILLEATVKAPENVSAWINLGTALQQDNKIENAQAAYIQALAINPNLAQVCNNLGSIAKDIEDWESARKYFEKAIAIRPDLAEVHNNLGITLQELGKLNDAEISYKKAIAIKPEYEEAHNNLGITLKDLKRLKDAEQSYKKAIAIKPDYAEAHSNLGITLQELGKLEEAETSYKKAIAIKPDFANAILNSAVLSVCQNQITDSIKHLKKVIEIDSGDFGLRAKVKLSVLSFIEDNLHAAHLQIENSKDIFRSKSKSVKNDAAYHILMDSLISWHRMHEYPSYEYIEQRLHVVGDSHSMSSNRLFIESLNGGSLCKVHWIAGCKQWHLGNSNRNQYKEQFERVIHSIDNESTILLSIGEIDCRIDNGILKHIKKYLPTNQSALIESTIENYLTYVYKITNIKDNHVVIQGVPCPNIYPAKVEEKDISILVDLIKDFNCELRNKSTKMGFEFLDLHTLTDRGDGYSNGIWHIDEYHLSPAGMLEAWKRHLA